MNIIKYPVCVLMLYFSSGYQASASVDKESRFIDETFHHDRIDMTDPCQLLKKDNIEEHYSDEALKNISRRALTGVLNKHSGVEYAICEYQLELRAWVPSPDVSVPPPYSQGKIKLIFLKWPDKFPGYDQVPSLLKGSKIEPFVGGISIEYGEGHHYLSLAYEGFSHNPFAGTDFFFKYIDSQLFEYHHDK